MDEIINLLTTNGESEHKITLFSIEIKIIFILENNYRTRLSIVDNKIESLIIYFPNNFKKNKLKIRLERIFKDIEGLLSGEIDIVEYSKPIEYEEYSTDCYFDHDRIINYNEYLKENIE